MNKSNIYLKLILTIIAMFLGLNLLINTNIFNSKLFAVTQTSEFQDMFKFIMGPKSNIRGNLMVLEYPGKGIYYINLDNVDNFIEGKDYIEFALGGKKFKLPKPEPGYQTEDEEEGNETEEGEEGNSNQNNNNTNDSNDDSNNDSNNDSNDEGGG